MNRQQQIPISFAKVNPSGQLVVGLEDGTVLNAGYVFGPTGSSGSTGSIGPMGPTGQKGPGITTLKTFENKLYYTIDNKTFIAGSLPAITGPTGNAGTIINRIYLDINGNLNFIADNGTLFNAGRVYGPTGMSGKIGPPGPPGPTGEQGKPFKIAKMQTMNNRLIVTNDENKSFDCGVIAVTGITGPAGYYDDIYVNDGGHLYFKRDGVIIDAGYVKGDTGSIGPTGKEGPQGPLNMIKECRIEDKRLVMVDRGGNKIHSIGEPIIGETGPTGRRGERGPVGGIRQASIDNFGQLVLVDYSNRTVVATGCDLHGPTGSTGPQGPPPILKLEYTDTILNIYTESETIKIQGPTGPSGPLGLLGPTGLRGLRGTTGLKGETGPTGPRFEFASINVSNDNRLVLRVASSNEGGDSDQVYKTDPLKLPTGPTGPLPIIDEISINESHQLVLKSGQQTLTTSQKLPRGPRGDVTTITLVSHENDILSLTDSNGKTHSVQNVRGHTGLTGPTGPVGAGIVKAKVVDNTLYLTNELGSEMKAGVIKTQVGQTGPKGATGPRGEMCHLRKVLVTPLTGQLTLVDNCGHFITSDASVYGPTGYTGPRGVGITAINNNIVHLSNGKTCDLYLTTGPTGPIGPVIKDGFIKENVLTLVLDNDLQLEMQGCIDTIVGPTGPMGCTGMRGERGPRGYIESYKGTGVFGTSPMEEEDVSKTYSYTIDSLRNPASYYPTHFGLGMHTSLQTTPDYTSIVLGNHACEAGPDNETNAIAIGNYSGQTRQGQHSIALGYCAGYREQQSFSIAIGDKAARHGQGAHSLAIGYKAGFKSCLAFSNCIGFRTEAPHANTNVINATSTPLESLQSDSTFIKPIRSVKASKASRFVPLYYDTETGEIVVVMNREEN